MVKFNHDPEFIAKFNKSMKDSGVTPSSPTSLDLMVLKKRQSNYDYSVNSKGIIEKSSSSCHPYHKNIHSDHIVSKPLDSIPRSYEAIVLNYVGYLADTAERKFVVRGRDLKTGEETIKEIPYVHRWTEFYRRGFLAKAYQLEAALGDDLSGCTMITLKYRHGDMSAEDGILHLRQKWANFLECLRYHYGTVDFFRAFEPHASGYVHLHIMYMRSISKDDQKILRHLWTEKYGFGSKRQGINFQSVRASENGNFSAGVVSKIKGYVMKYVGKGLIPRSDDPDYDYTFREKHIKLKMAPKQLLFNALLKKTKTRLWGASRNFSKIMARPKKENPDWECTEVSQMRNDELVNFIWTKEKGKFPKEVKVMKFFGRFPSVVCKTVRTAFFLYTVEEKIARSQGCTWEVKGLHTDLHVPFPHYLSDDQLIQLPNTPFYEKDGDFVNIFEKVYVPVDAL